MEFGSVMMTKYRLKQMRKWMISEIPTDIAQAQLVAKGTDGLIALEQAVGVIEVGNGLIDRLETLQGALLDVQRVKLGDFEFLLAREVHHEYIEGVSARQLSITYLVCHGFNQASEVLVIVVPVTAGQLRVHECHKRVRLVNIQIERLFIVL